MNEVNNIYNVKFNNHYLDDLKQINSNFYKRNNVNPTVPLLFNDNNKLFIEILKNLIENNNVSDIKSFIINFISNHIEDYSLNPIDKKQLDYIINNTFKSY